MVENNAFTLLFKIKDLPIDKTAGTVLDSRESYVGFHDREQRFYEIDLEAFMGYGACSVGAFVNMRAVRRIASKEVLELCRIHAPDKYHEIEKRIKVADCMISAPTNVTPKNTAQKASNAKSPDAKQIEASVLKDWERFDWESGKPVESASPYASLLCSFGRFFCFYIPATNHFFTVEQDGNYYHGYDTVVTLISKFQALEYLHKRIDYLRRWNDLEELAQAEAMLQMLEELPN